MNVPTPATAPIIRHIQINPTTVLDIDGDAAEREKKAAAKKPFVRKPHLTDRPFQNDSLKALRDEMQKKQQRNTRSKRVNIKNK